MITHWLLYIGAVIGCGVFCWAYREWFAWLAFLGVAWSSVASLILSLPAMLTLRFRRPLPPRVEQGSEQTVKLQTAGKMTAPPFRCKMTLENCVTGEQFPIYEGDPIPTEHCCKWVLHTKRLRVYDYLGLFFWRVPLGNTECLVWPQIRKLEDTPNLEQFIATSWIPKAGGGFSENHELREYRPGDNLNQVHWKLTAKTGHYIVREPMVPANRKVLVDLVFRGTGDELDACLGHFLWLSSQLLEQGISFETRMLTREGVRREKVKTQDDVEKLIGWVLGQRCAAPGQAMPTEEASWYIEIGGDGL